MRDPRPRPMIRAFAWHFGMALAIALALLGTSWRTLAAASLTESAPAPRASRFT